MSKLTCCRHKIKFYSHFDFSYISTKPHYLISFKTQIFWLFRSQNHADVTDSQMDCLQGQDVTQEAVHGVTTDTNVHTTALMSSYASPQAASNSRPAATSAHSAAVSVQPTEPPGASQSPGAGSSTSLAPPDGFTGTHTLAPTLKAGSPPTCGSVSPLPLLPVVVLTYCVHNWMSSTNSTTAIFKTFFPDC